MERIFIFAFATLAVCIAAFLCAAFRSIGKSRGFAPAACLAALAVMSVLWAGRKPQQIKEPDFAERTEQLADASDVESQPDILPQTDGTASGEDGGGEGHCNWYEGFMPEWQRPTQVRLLWDRTEPTVHPANASIFTRPDGAVTPEFWTRHSVCDDFRYVGDSWIVGVCGLATTKGQRFNSPSNIEIFFNVCAPFLATNSMILGTSEFWAFRTDVSQQYVWKNFAYNRDPSKLVSFAAEIFEWLDVVEYTYGDIPEDGFSSFLQIYGERMDLTQHCGPNRTVRIEKNSEPNAKWYLEKFGDICSTNESGEIVWNYDTNEWIIATFEFSLSDGDASASGVESANAAAPLRASAAEVHGEKSCTLRFELPNTNALVHIWPKHGHDLSPKLDSWCRSGTHSFTMECPLRLGVLHNIDVVDNYTKRPINIKRVYETTKYGVKLLNVKDNLASLVYPLKLGIAGAYSDAADYFPLKASLTPQVSGGEFSWSVSNGNLRVENSSSATTTASRTGNGGGTVICRWQRINDNGTISEAEGYIKIAAKPDDWVPTNRYFSVSTDPAVVLFEPEHLDENGNKVAFAAPQSKVTVGYNGMMNGTIRFEAKSGWSDRYSVFCDNAKIDLPYTYSVAGASTKDFIVRASGESSNTNGVVFSAVLLDDDSEVVSDSASVVFAKVGVASKADSNSATRRHVFGPMETVCVQVEPSNGAAAEFGPYHMETNLTLSVPTIGGNFDVPISVIAPKARVAARARVMTESVAEDETFDLPEAGQVGAVVLFEGVECVPDCVSFDGLVVTEGEAEPSGLSGYFAAHPGAAGRHGTEQGAGKAVLVTNRTSLGSDVAGYFWPSLPAPLASGGFHWDIPVSWSAAGGEPHVFTTNRQSFALSANGDFTVTKLGLSATRGTNGVEKATH